MCYHHFSELLTAYLDSLTGRASYRTRCRVAAQWASQLTDTPTRAQCLSRLQTKGQTTPTQANEELSLVRAACRWGLYHEHWRGGDPTAGIKKWRTAKRRTICKYEHLKALVGYWQQADSVTQLRDRALFGLMLFTGCRPSEIRLAHLGSIVPYGLMGCWRKPTTKTGEPHEIPVPGQVMEWLHAWLAVRDDPRGINPYLFPGLSATDAMAESTVRLRWRALCDATGIQGLWNYDLRRTMASYLGNELHYDDKTIQAVLNHHDGRAISHYYHVSFDALCGVIQRYAEWVCGLARGEGRSVPSVERRSRSSVPRFPHQYICGRDPSPL